jgi:hypothetical protein
MEYALSNTHWLDGFTPPLERQFALLAKSVNALLGHDVEPMADSALTKPAAATGTMQPDGSEVSRTEPARSESKLGSQRKPDISAGFRQNQRAFWLTSIAASAIGLAALAAILIATMWAGRPATALPRLADLPKPPDPSKLPVKPQSSFAGAEPTVAAAGPQVKAVLDGLRPKATSATAKPTIPAPPRERIPPAGPGRRAVSVSGDGWSVEHEKLVKEGLIRGNVSFGDESWTDYDLTCEMRKNAGPGYLVAAFRQNSVNGYYRLRLGTGAANDTHSLVRWSASGVVTDVSSTPGKIQPFEWYRIKISLRGPLIHIELNDRLIMALTDGFHARGNVALVCIDATGQFQNIKVTAPDGTVLWEGPPDLPEPASTPTPTLQAPPSVEVRKQAPAAPPDPEKDPKIRNTVKLEYREGIQLIKQRALFMSTNRAAEFKRTEPKKLLQILAKKHELEIDQVKRIVDEK